MNGTNKTGRTIEKGEIIHGVTVDMTSGAAFDIVDRNGTLFAEPVDEDPAPTEQPTTSEER